MGEMIELDIGLRVLLYVVGGILIGGGGISILLLIFKK